MIDTPFHAPYLALAMDHAPVAMGVLEGPEFVVRLLNKAAERISGISASEALGRPVLDVVPDARALRPFLQRAYDGEKVEFDAQVGLPSGKRSLHIVYVPLPEQPGAPRRLLYIVVDQTAADTTRLELERQVEEQRRTAEQLAESERRFRAMVDSIPQLAWMANADGYIFWYNRRWYEYTGTTPDQMEGWGWQSVHDPAVLPRVLERWRGSIASGEPFDMQFPLRGADGRFRWFLTRVMPLKNAEGQVVRWFGTNTDVNENAELAAALRRANEDLEQRVEARTQDLKRYVRELEAFSYAAAHDLRAPVRTITSFTELAIQQSGSTLPAPARQSLERSLSAARKMTSIIDGLLRLSRLTTSRLEIAEVDLSGLAGEVAASFSVQDPGRAVAWDIEPGLKASGDPKLLRILLENLLGNAWKYTSRSPQARISFRRAGVGGAPEFVVEDNGVGFSVESAAKLFEPFSRLHSEDQFPGVGLGLAICKRIAERHGGAIRAEGETGRGARISFTLGKAWPRS